MSPASPTVSAATTRAGGTARETTWSLWSLWSLCRSGMGPRMLTISMGSTPRRSTPDASTDWQPDCTLVPRINWIDEVDAVEALQHAREQRVRAPERLIRREHDISGGAMSHRPSLGLLPGDKEVGEWKARASGHPALALVLLGPGEHHCRRGLPDSHPAIQRAGVALLCGGPLRCARPPHEHADRLARERVDRGHERSAAEHERDAQGVQSTHGIELDRCGPSAIGGVCGIGRICRVGRVWGGKRG